MSTEIQKAGKKKESMSFFDYFTEVIGWLQIVLSPLLFGLATAIVIYGFYPTTAGLVIAIGVVLFALIIGIIFATRIWKKQGTINFVSRVSATPELDNPDEGKTHNSKS